MNYASGRSFQIWDYNVSHQQLLIRSPRSLAEETNLDVACGGVEYVDLPTSFTGLVVGPPSEKDLARAEQVLSRPCKPEQVYRFETGGASFLIVAAGLTILENDLDLFDSSLESFNNDVPDRNRGTVLAHS